MALLEVRDLKVHFNTDDGVVSRATRPSVMTSGVVVTTLIRV